MDEVKETPQGRTRQHRGILQSIIDMLLKCPRCQHSQHTYVYQLDDKKWIKCQACDELIPSGAWGVIAVGNKVRQNYTTAESSKEGTMKRYRFVLSIDDEVYSETEYEAWEYFRNRVIERYYGPIDKQIELLEEIPPTASIAE